MRVHSLCPCLSAARMRDINEYAGVCFAASRFRMSPRRVLQEYLGELWWHSGRLVAWSTLFAQLTERAREQAPQSSTRPARTLSGRPATRPPCAPRQATHGFTDKESKWEDACKIIEVVDARQAELKLPRVSKRKLQPEQQDAGAGSTRQWHSTHVRGFRRVVVCVCA